MSRGAKLGLSSRRGGAGKGGSLRRKRRTMRTKSMLWEKNRKYAVLSTAEWEILMILSHVKHIYWDPQLDMWVSGAGTLGAADFGLLNFSNGSVDFNVHPNFSSGVNGVRTG